MQKLCSFVHTYIQIDHHLTRYLSSHHISNLSYVYSPPQIVLDPILRQEGTWNWLHTLLCPSLQANDKYDKLYFLCIE